jgi:hypothetical protein
VALGLRATRVILGPMKRILILCAAALACGCPPEEGVFCTAIAAAGLSVGVTNEQTSQPLCDATVTATEDGYSETLVGNGCRYVGAWERPGTYRVRAEAPGFGAKTIGDVRVAMGTGECPHVQEMQLEIPLAPIR